MKLSSHSSRVLKELVEIIKSMKMSSVIDFSVGEMNSAVEDLQTTLKSLSTQLISHPLTVVEVKDNPIISTTTEITVPFIDVIPIVTLSSLLIEITTRIEKIVEAVDELSRMANFKLATEHKKQNHQPKQNQTNPDEDIHHQENQETMKTLQMV